MKHYPFLFAGIFFVIFLSFSVLVLTSNIQIGNLKPVAMEEGGELYPKARLGFAEQGKEEYIRLGCVYCHSQQVTRKGFRADQERGWGDRMTVPRDYIYEKRTLLGTMRTGPDLISVGDRLIDPSWHYLHLYDPALTSSGSIMPPFRYLFKKQKINQNNPSAMALQFPQGYKYAPEEGYEIVPTERAEKLVAYLLSLKLDYELPEAPFVE